MYQIITSAKWMNEWMVWWSYNGVSCLMVCSRTQGITATLEDRGVCVCLKEEEKKSQRHNVWQSQPFTAPDTVWKSILTDTSPSGVNTDQHHWKQEEQVGPLLDEKSSIGTLGARDFLDGNTFEGSSCTLVVLHWNHLRFWVLKHWPPVGLHCTCFDICRRKVSTRVKNVQMFMSQIWLENYQKKQRRPWSWQVRKITLSSSTASYECCVLRRHVRIIQNSRAQFDMTAGHSF